MTTTDNLPATVPDTEIAEAEVEQTVTAAEARAMVDALTGMSQNVQRAAREWHLLFLQVYRRGAWRALGYTSWVAFVEEELGITRQRAYRLLHREAIIDELHELGVVDARSMAVEQVVSVTQAEALAGSRRSAREIAQRVRAGTSPRRAVRDVSQAREAEKVEARRRGRSVRTGGQEAEAPAKRKRRPTEVQVKAWLAELRQVSERHRVLQREVEEVLARRRDLFAKLNGNTTSAEIAEAAGVTAGVITQWRIKSGTDRA